MTREEAIQIIKNLPIYRMEQEYDRESDLMKALKMAVESLGNDTNVGGKWIPCSERLPDKAGFYVVTKRQRSGEIQVALGSYRLLFNEWSGNGNFKDVLAWLPLPEPYKEGET